MTSSPGPISSASRTRTSASVPLATPTLPRTPRYSAASCWKAWKFGPLMYWPPSITSRNADSSSPLNGANWDLTSTRGIGCTAAHSSDVNEIRRQQKNACNDCKLDVSEIVVRMRVRGSESPAGAGQPEAEDRTTDQGQDEEFAERHADDPGRDRDEGAQQRRGQPDRDRPVVVAVEAGLGACELLIRHVDVAAVAVKQRASAEVADPPADRAAEHVAERPRDGERDVRPEVRVDGCAEGVHRLGRERSPGDRPGVEHDQLAAHRDQGGSNHQEEDRKDAVVRDDAR